MFLKKKRKYQKITQEQLMTVERIQDIGEEITHYRNDFYNLDFLAWHKNYDCAFGYFQFDSEYKEVLKKYIKEKIEQLQQERKKLIKGDDE